MDRILRCICILLVFLCKNAIAGTNVDLSYTYQNENSQVTVYSGVVQLPFQGVWRLQESQALSQVQEMYLRVDYGNIPQEDLNFLRSKLSLQMEREQKINIGSSVLRSLYYPLQRYAKDHSSVGPASFADLDLNKKKDNLSIELNKKRWQKRYNEQVSGDFAFLIPKVSFGSEKNANQRMVRSRKNKLMVEMHPYVEDGKQWVLYTDGSVEREEIDPELITQYGLKITPIVPKDQPKRKAPELKQCVVSMVCQKGFDGPLSFTVENVSTGERKTIQWDFSNAQQDKKKAKNELADARCSHWLSYARNITTPVLSAWYDFYKEAGRGLVARERGRNRQTRELTVYKVLGGRAAVAETLQMQSIESASQKGAENTIPIDTVQGVEVESHPFAKMLQESGGSGPDLPLANVAPHDHFFVHVGKPQTLLSFLDKGVDFLSQSFGMVQSNAIHYDLATKYLARLGLDKRWLRMFLGSGEVEEMALLFPDLFFIDGTEITVVARLAHPKPVQLLLPSVGVTGLGQGLVREHALADGDTVFWALFDNLLLCSSSREEVEKVIALHRARGKGSLGQSDEFRYMLTKLAPEKKSRFFAYLSDPFIRQLVGPETKIAQLRRLTARQEMEWLSSRALLAKMDGFGDQLSLNKLANMGYVPKHFIDQGYTIDSNYRVHSAQYGTVAFMRSLGQNPVSMISKSEQQSYKRYVDNYNRYWRRYFDPIAIRVNDTEDGGLEMTTFILPLVDNTIYNSLRQTLLHAGQGSELTVPQLSIIPTMMLSLHLQERSLIQLAKKLKRFVPPTLLDTLGSEVHLAVYDSNPVIATGSGDILGAFNGNFFSGGRGGLTLYLPMALSVLTRPCTMFIETSNPQDTLAALRNISKAGKEQRERRFTTDICQITGENRWLMNVDIFGVITLRYEMEVQGDYLLVRNIPWEKRETITGVKKVPLQSAFLQVFPTACKKQLPALFTVASDTMRSAALKNMAYLYPLLASGYAKTNDVEQKHFELFGFKPVHPGKGAWQWNGQHIASPLYGAVAGQKQPGYREDGERMGLLRNIDWSSLNMQFEDAGLRASLRLKNVP